MISSFLSFQSPLQFLGILSVCPFHFPCVSFSLPLISLHLPSCPLVSSPSTSPFLSFGFLVLSSLSFPLPSPCSHSFPRRFPFISPCFPVIPFAVPCMFLHVPLSPPLRFPALPCIPLHFMVFSQEKVCFLEKEVKPTHGFSRCEAEQPEPAKSRQGDSSLGPCFATPALRTLFLVERHEIAKRPAPAPRIGRGGSGGRFILYPLFGI